MRPTDRNQAWFALLAMPTTVAPVRAASWAVIEPTPPAAADTTTISPLLGATARTHATAAAPAMNREPATSQDSSGRLRDELRDRYRDELRVARTLVRPAEHGVPGSELAHALADRDDLTRKVASLAGRKR